MNRDERKEFLENFLKSVSDHIMDNADQMPDEWDGIELRAYVAHKFTDENSFLNQPEMRKRKRAFTNTLRVTNL